jgi:predicted CopG family antitoxin
MGRAIKVSDQVYKELNTMRKKKGHTNFDCVIRELLWKWGTPKDRFKRSVEDLPPEELKKILVPFLEEIIGETMKGFTVYVPKGDIEK